MSDSKEEQIKRLFIQHLKHQLKLLENMEPLDTEHSTGEAQLIYERMIATETCCRILLADLHGKAIPQKLFPG